MKAVHFQKGDACELCDKCVIYVEYTYAFSASLIADRHEVTYKEARSSSTASKI